MVLLKAALRSIFIGANSRVQVTLKMDDEANKSEVKSSNPHHFGAFQRQLGDQSDRLRYARIARGHVRRLEMLSSCHNGHTAYQPFCPRNRVGETLTSLHDRTSSQLKRSSSTRKNAPLAPHVFRKCRRGLTRSQLCLALPSPSRRRFNIVRAQLAVSANAITSPRPPLRIE